MSPEASDEQALSGQTEQAQLDHIQELLNTALNADAPERKDHAIRDALQLLVATENPNDE